jgi:hypothetical protein
MVVVLPLSQLLIEQMDVLGHAVGVQQLVKLLIVDAMRALHLPVEMGRAWADVDVSISKSCRWP